MAPRTTGLLLTGLLHLALLLALLWQQRVAVIEDHGPERASIQWLRFTPAAPMPAPSHAKPAMAAPALKTRPATTARQAVPLAKPIAAEAITTEPVAPAPTATQPPPVPAPATVSIDEIMRIAKRDIGKIDKDLQKEFPDRGPKLTLDTPQARLERGFDAAHAAVLPKWYEPARVEALNRPGGGPPMFRITTALGAYCITIQATGDKIYHMCPQ